MRPGVDLEIRGERNYPRAMKRILFALSIVLIFAGAVRALEVGDAESNVTLAFGNPVAVRKKADGSRIWRFKDGSTVWTAEGVVQKVEGPMRGNHVRHSPSGEWVALAATPAQPLGDGTSATAASQAVEKTHAIDSRRALAYLGAFGGLALIGGFLRGLAAMVRPRDDSAFGRRVGNTSRDRRPAV